MASTTSRLLPVMLLLVVTSCAKHTGLQTTSGEAGGDVPFTATQSQERSADWSPDGSKLLFSGSAYVGIGVGGSWSPDGDEVACVKQVWGGKDI